MDSSCKCLICGCSIEDQGQTRLSCSRCDTSYHKDCWDYAGGCAVFGCDPDRWNPRTFSSEETWQSFLTKVQWWSDAFKLQWFCLLLLSFGLIGGLIVFPSFFILSRHNEWLRRMIPVLVNYSLLFPLFFLAGFLGYVTFWIPATLTRRSLESELGNKLMLPSDLPKRALDEVGVTFLGRINRAFVNLLTWSANAGIALIFISHTIFYFKPWYLHREFPLPSFIMLCLARFLLIPVLRASMVSRLFHLSSMQGRVASSTYGK